MAAASVRAKIVRIGNSRGVRIPAALLEATGLGREVEVEMRAASRTLVLRAVRAPREGWDEAFRVMAERDEDRIVDWPPPAPRWDQSEWRWPRRR